MPPKPPPDGLRRHMLTAYLLTLYLPLIIIPWVVLCVLDVKPMTRAGSSYVATQGQYAPGDVKAVDAWRRAAEVLNTAAAILAVPVVSAILAHAAVVMVQRRNPERPLDLRRLLLLSDGVGVRLPTSHGDGLFARAGFALVVLSVVMPLLQSALVVPKSIRVATCRDMFDYHSRCDGSWSSNFLYIGYDPEPSCLAIAPVDLVLQGVSSRLATVSSHSPLMHSWEVDVDGYDDDRKAPGTIARYYHAGHMRDNYTIPYFVSALPPRTNTGVLRQHALRLNSTHTCEAIAASAYPTTCSGEQPFTGSFSTNEIELRFCAPGSYDTAPWTLSRNRQDRSELFFVDVAIPENGTILSYSSLNGNFTVRCEAKTTRGYFELPNYYNNNTAGPLLDEWPSYEDLDANFNDVLSYSGYQRIPSEIDAGVDADSISWPYVPDFRRLDVHAPGPLMTSLLAMLGNNTFFATIANATGAGPGAYRDAFAGACKGPFPLLELSLYGGFQVATIDCEDVDYILSEPDEYAERRLSLLVYRWFETFTDIDVFPESLGAALYHSHEQLLTIVAGATQDRYARPMIWSAGTAATKPSVPLATKIVISVLLAVQAAALVALGIYTYSAKTFGHALDSMAFLAIGTSATARGRPGSLYVNDVPRLGLFSERDLKKLEDVDGTAALRAAIGERDVGESLELSSRASTEVELAYGTRVGA